MAHNLLSNRFYNNRTAPAWHRLGINDETPHSAEEALRRVGLFNVEKLPLYATMPDGTVLKDTGLFGVFREPIAEDNAWRRFGNAVTSDYELVTPIDAARLWDTNVTDADGKPAAIETLGVLGKGEHLFICVKLPSSDVLGDQVDMYMLFNSPLTPGAAMGVFTTGVRTVCQNTLNAGIAAAIERRTLTHDKGVKDVIGGWLKDIYGGALVARELINEAYAVLAHKPVQDVQIEWIAETIYPMPRRPQESDRSRTPIEEREHWYDLGVAYTQRLRDEVLSLYNGKGVGMDTRAVQGTAFGAYNAVAELETYRRGGFDKAAQGLIDGERARRIRGAFNLCMNVDQWQTLDVTKFGFRAPLEEELQSV